MKDQYYQLENKIAIFLPGLEKALKIALAVAISAHFKPHVMLWLLFVDVPSSGKTDIVRLIKESEITHYLDKLTTNAFISGERATKTNKVYDLLPLLDGKCFIVKDWTSIFSADEKTTKALLGDLVNIYDREFVKHSSARGTIRHESYFSHLGCITPATLNKHTQYLNLVGARFLFYKLPELSKKDEELSKKRIFAGENRTEIERLVQQQVASFLQDLLKQPWNIKPLTQVVQTFLDIGSNLIAHCRGIVYFEANTFNDEQGKTIKYYEPADVQIEKQWRALHQLKALIECLVFTTGKEEVDIEELEVIKEIVISSMPADRSQALRVIKESGGTITAKELSEQSEKAVKTSRRLLDELTALKVLEKIKGTGVIASDYRIVDQFKNFICLSPSDFLSSYSSGTETPPSTPSTSDGTQPELDENFKFSEFN